MIYTLMSSEVHRILTIEPGRSACRDIPGLAIYRESGPP
jgi:hypothetical protein